MLRSIGVCAVVLMGAMSTVGAAQAQKVAVQNAAGAASKTDQNSNQTVLVASLSSTELSESGSAEVAESSSSSSSSGILAVPQAPAKAKKSKRIGPFSTVAIGIRATSLGLGMEVATPLTRTLNLRSAGNFFNMGYGFGVDGANYKFDLHLRTEQISVDWFPFHGGFHISPGLLIYDSQLSGTENVPGGNTFQLGAASFTSSPTDPVHGNASLTFGRTLMPSLTFGFSNMIPRSGRHWSVPFEIGAAYMGHNTVHLNLQGTACTQGVCRSTSDPAIQQNLLVEQDNLNESMKRLQAYPILSTGFSYRF